MCVLLCCHDQAAFVLVQKSKVNISEVFTNQKLEEMIYKLGLSVARISSCGSSSSNPDWILQFASP